MSTSNYCPERPRVIVRSFGDEPVVLYAHGLQVDKKRVLVGKANAKRPISLPFTDVFDFDDGHFRELSEAFRARDRVRLGELYKSLGQSKGPCIRYQDALIYAHEEKGQIPDTRSAA
jgi:hypothetical protein